MGRSLWALSFALIFACTLSHATPTNTDCKCGPGDNCWPSIEAWDSLNLTVSGQLLKTTPIAASCYPGVAYNADKCQSVDDQWADARFQALSPVGLDYPVNSTCPPVNLTAGEIATGPCTLGTNPRYAVSATCVEDVSAAVRFAREHNIRLVIKTTGHDLLGRSDGYGSLEVWLKYLRTGVKYSKSFHSQCSDWTGSSITIGGGYTWDDVYPVAKANNVVVVGGGTPSVSTLGGWMQGGGHGPASRQFGLGADQVLSAEVVLADGEVVTASACENQDLYFAIRGGGPGTYGVVTKTVIKAWPMVNATVQHLAIAPLTANTSSLLDAVAVLFHDFPDLNDAGYAGYGTWSIDSPAPLFANFTAGYVHGIYMFNQSIQAAEAAFASTLKKLLPYNGTSLFISVSYLDYPDYWYFYFNESGVESPAGQAGAVGSRLFSRASVRDNSTSLRSMLSTISGEKGEYTSNAVELVSGGAVFSDASDPYSGLNPAWRISYFNNIVSRGLPSGSNQSATDAVWADVMSKMDAMEKQAPDTGAYMNEASRLDPDWQHNFYGSHYERLSEIKQKRDPTSVFYCPTCVGSEVWMENRDDGLGKLCRA